MNEREIMQAWEACRSGADDLDRGVPPDPAALAEDLALRRRFEQIQHWDRSIGQVLRQVPAPAGLSERLLAALAAQADPAGLAAGGPAAVASADMGVEAETPADRMPAERKSRRWLLAAAVFASAAVVMLAFFLSDRSRPVPQPTADFAGQVIAWSDLLGGQDWRGDFSSLELEEYPFDPAIRAVPRRWTLLPTPYHPATLVYDITPPRGPLAYLYCFPAASPAGLPDSPPEKPFSTTGGFSLGMWQREGRVYVLSVQGGPRRYRALIDSPVILGRLNLPGAAFLEAAA